MSARELAEPYPFVSTVLRAHPWRRQDDQEQHGECGPQHGARRGEPHEPPVEQHQHPEEQHSGEHRAAQLPRPVTVVTPPPAEAGGFSLRRVGVATDQPGP